MAEQGIVFHRALDAVCTTLVIDEDVAGAWLIERVRVGAIGSERDLSDVFAQIDPDDDAPYRVLEIWRCKLDAGDLKKALGSRPKAGGRRLKNAWVEFAIEAGAILYQTTTGITDDLELRKRTVDALAKRGIEISDDKTARGVAKRVWARFHD